MKLKEGFVLRQVCGENVITGEGLGAINFGKLLALNETAAWLWKEAEAQGEFTVNSLADKLCEEYIRVITGPGSRVRFATVCKLKIDAQSAYEKTMLF